MTILAQAQNIPAIVTMDGPQAHILKEKTTDFAPTDLDKANEIAQQLFSALAPQLPAAGLAAPQIGIGRSIFIYSYDRDPKHLEVAINPTYQPLETETVEGWEACFSAIISDGTYKMAKVPRHTTIEATYLNTAGQTVVRRLEGFGAKVFQHEWDHLQGMVNINRPEAEVKAFASRDELQKFLADVKKQDAVNYKKPN